MSEKSDLRDASLQDLESLATEVEHIAYQLENVCERLDAQHATVVTALLAIMRKTGAELPPEIVNAHRPDEDELYDKARQAVIEADKASTSFLQRRLGLGYSRAARLLDLLEENGVISAEDGVKPRQVLKTE